MWKKQFAAVFLDMDGALLDSGNHAQQVWMQWAQQHGIDEALLGEQIHSQRVQEIVRRLAPHLDTQQEVHALEAALLQMTQRHQSQLQQGVSELLKALGETPWGVVTQSHHARAEAQLQQAGMQRPPLMVGAEQVSSGRPDPEPYLLAASFYACAKHKPGKQDRCRPESLPDQGVRRPCSWRSATRLAICWRRLAAIALPSISCAVITRD